MSQVESAPVTEQPQVNVRAINNSFALMGNEKYEQEWRAEEGCCGCKHTYHTIVTDTRLLLRHEEANACCCCFSCGDPIPYDTALFLRDIAQLEETKKNNCCTCLIPCLQRCFCASDTLTEIQVKGAFGEEKIHINEDDLNFVLVVASTFIGNHKIVVHNRALV